MSRTSIWLSVPIILSCLVRTSCERTQSEKPVVTSRDDLYVYLDSLERRYEAACVRMGLATWNDHIAGACADLDAARESLFVIFTDTAARVIIDDWRGRSGSLADEQLARRLELWHRCFIGGSLLADSTLNALEQKLRRTIGVPSTREKLIALLRDEPRQSRRHTLWSLTSQLSSIAEPDLIQLVKLRNERAQALGFPNYYSLALYLEAIDEEWLVRVLNLLEKESYDAFQEFLDATREGLRVAKLGPWDFDYALRGSGRLPDRLFRADSLSPMLHRLQDSIGFDVDSLPIRTVMKEGRFTTRCCIVRIPKDVRVLINPTMKGKDFFASVLHEYADALGAVLTDVEYPILEGYEWIPGAQCRAYREGIAEMFSEFTDDSTWLSTYTTATPKQIGRYVSRLHATELYRLRHMLMEFSIEYELYKNPERNTARLEHEMIEKYLLVAVDSTEPAQFAAEPTYAYDPCSHHDRILGKMLATQLQEALSSKFGEKKCTDTLMAGWITKHLYETGETLEWTERVRYATGKSLETGAYLRKLGIVPMKLITQAEAPIGLQ